MAKNNDCKNCQELSKNLDDLKKDHELLNNQLRLLQADFDNYKKRSAKEACALSDLSKAELMLAILNDLEVFSKACSVTTDEGFKMIYKNLMKSLKKEGLEEIKSVGEKFDINLHEALMTVNDAKR